jgi:hypothetical protein
LTTRERSGVNMEAYFGRMPIDLPSVRDAARRELRAQVAAATDDLSTAILERLAANEPITSPLLFFAVRSSDASLSSSAERQIAFPLAAQIEATFQAEVNEFCRKFFDLEPETRRAGWNVLRRRTAASPALTACLEELSRGLDVDCRALSDQTPAVQRLAALVREFFVLPPLERAARRREWLAGHEAEAKSVRPAGWHLSWSFRQTARLDPIFLQTLRSPDRPRRWWNRVRIDTQTVKQDPIDKFVRTRPKTSVAFIAFCVAFGAAVALINQRPSPQYVPIQPLPQIHYPVRSRLPPNSRIPKKSAIAGPTTKKAAGGQ